MGISLAKKGRIGRDVSNKRGKGVGFESEKTIELFILSVNIYWIPYHALLWAKNKDAVLAFMELTVNKKEKKVNK